MVKDANRVLCDRNLFPSYTFALRMRQLSSTTDFLNNRYFVFCMKTSLSALINIK